MAGVVEPVSLLEMFAHLRLDVPDDLDQQLYVQSLITAARRACEATISRSVVGTAMSLTLDAFPAALVDPELPTDPDALVIELAGGQVSAITAITYLDATDATQALAPTAYVADLAAQPAKIAPAVAPGAAWPATAAQPGAVTIAYVVSPMSGDDLAVVAQAVMLLAGFWYKNRASVAVDVRGAPAELPLTVSWMLTPLRQWPTD